MGDKKLTSLRRPSGAKRRGPLEATGAQAENAKPDAYETRLLARLAELGPPRRAAQESTTKSPVGAIGA